MLSSRSCARIVVSPSTPGPHDVLHRRLGDRCGLLHPVRGNWLRLHEKRRRELERVLPLGTAGAMVARGRIDGRHHVRGRHPARRHRTRGDQGSRRELAVVVLRHERDAHGVLFRATLAPRTCDDRHRICRDSIQRRAGHVSARISRYLSRRFRQPDHPRLGDEGDDQDSHDLAGDQSVSRGRHLLRDHGRLLGGCRNVGGVVDRPDSVRHQDDRRHRAGDLRSESRARHRRAQDQSRRALRKRRRTVGASRRHERRRARRIRVDAAARARRVSLRAVVGGMVSGCRARWRRLRRATDFLGEDGAGRRAGDTRLQRRTLCASALAMDHYGPVHRCPISQRDRTHR